MSGSDLRALLAGPPIVVAPGIYDALTALLASQAGFKALYLSGASIAYTRFGRPDLGLVGMDEVDTARGRVSWISPLARALLKAREGDVVNLRTPAGVEQIEIVEIRYEALP